MNRIVILTVFFFGLLTIFTGSSISVSAQISDPTAAQTAEWRRLGKCNDPWVSMAVYNGVTLAQTTNGSDGECDITQYSNGQWSNYDQLKKGVDAAKADMQSKGFKWDGYTAGGTKALFLLGSDDKIIFARLVGNDGASLVGNDGASFKTILMKLVAAGGGNVVPTGAGRLKAMGLIGTDSAGILSNANAAILSNANAGMLSVVKFTPTFSLKSAGAKKSFKIGTANYVIK